MLWLIAISNHLPVKLPSPSLFHLRNYNRALISETSQPLMYSRARREAQMLTNTENRKDTEKSANVSCQPAGSD